MLPIRFFRKVPAQPFGVITDLRREYAGRYDRAYITDTMRDGLCINTYGQHGIAYAGVRGFFDVIDRHFNPPSCICSIEMSVGSGVSADSMVNGSPVNPILLANDGDVCIVFITLTGPSVSVRVQRQCSSTRRPYSRAPYEIAPGEVCAVMCSHESVLDPAEGARAVELLNNVHAQPRHVLDRVFITFIPGSEADIRDLAAQLHLRYIE